MKARMKRVADSDLGQEVLGQMDQCMLFRNVLRLMAFVLLFLWLLVPGPEAAKGRGEPKQAREDQTMRPQIPQSLKSEHEELHKQLAKAVNSGGATASAAEAVARLLHPHFVKEEEYALPPLGLLRQLSEGKVTLLPALAPPLT